MKIVHATGHQGWLPVPRERREFSYLCNGKAAPWLYSLNRSSVQC